MGGFISCDRGAYAYLPESVFHFASAKHYEEIMRRVGPADVNSRALTGGVAGPLRDKEVAMIRPFSPSDLESLLRIESQSFPKSPYDRTTLLSLHALYPETFLVYVGTNDGQKGEKILGYIVFSRDGHIISIAVHPDHRRKGIGGELLQWAMKTLPLEKAWAEVRRSNQGAQAFYSKMGFRRIGMVPNYYGNEDALIVEWTPPFLNRLTPSLK